MGDDRKGKREEINGASDELRLLDEWREEEGMHIRRKPTAGSVKSDDRRGAQRYKNQLRRIPDSIRTSGETSFRNLRDSRYARYKNLYQSKCEGSHKGVAQSLKGRQKE